MVIPHWNRIESVETGVRWLYYLSYLSEKQKEYACDVALMYADDLYYIRPYRTFEGAPMHGPYASLEQAQEVAEMLFMQGVNPFEESE